MVRGKKVKGYNHYDKKGDIYIAKFPIGINLNSGFMKYKIKFIKNKKDAESFLKNIGGINYGN